MEPALPFLIGVVPVVSKKRPTSYLDNEFAVWTKEIRSLESSFFDAEMYAESRIGNAYRWMPVSPDIDRNTRLRRASHSFPQWHEIVVGVSSPILATAFFKVLKEWLSARSSRQIKLKFGNWQVDFKGLSVRQVRKLFEVLQGLAQESPALMPDKYQALESRRIKGLLKDEGVEAATLKALRYEQQREPKLKETRSNRKKANKSQSRRPTKVRIKGTRRASRK